MSLKKKGHSRKQRIGVGIPAQGRQDKSKTNVLGRKKPRRHPGVPCPACKEELKPYLLVSPSGKKKVKFLCTSCDLPVLAKWYM